MAKKKNPRDATARVASQARKRADAKLEAELKAHKQKIKVLQQQVGTLQRQVKQWIRER